MLDLKLLVKDGPRMHKLPKTWLPFTSSWAELFHHSSTLLATLINKIFAMI